MTTRRAIVALLLAAGLTAPGAGATPPAPQLRDPAGDSVLEGQDILWARLSGVLVQGVPHLRAELRLAAPPVSGSPNNYLLSFVHGCDRLELAATVAVTESAPSARYERRPYCYDALTDTEPDASYPATVTLRGSTLTWVAPYANGMRRGTVLSHVAVQAFTLTGTGKVSPLPVGPVTLRGFTVRQGDDAYEPEARYVVGSDLPRR
jgi:hypothetical protein